MENDDCTFNEIRKRKRIARVHGDDDSHADSSSKYNDTYTKGDTIEDVYFLTVDPDSEVCRE